VEKNFFNMALVDVDVKSKDEACTFKIALSGQK
jgi:hypothetical protein